MYSSQLSNFQILAVRKHNRPREILVRPQRGVTFWLFFAEEGISRRKQLGDQEVKSAASPAPKFKKKGNEKQFEVNSQVLDNVQSASSILTATPPRVDKALEELKEREKKLAHRNKLILIADSAEEGWEVVNEYQRRDLADDSDDDKRIRQAETRASQKRRRAQSQKKTPNLSQGSSFPRFSGAPRASSPVLLLQT